MHPAVYLPALRRKILPGVPVAPQSSVYIHKVVEEKTRSWRRHAVWEGYRNCDQQRVWRDTASTWKETRKRNTLADGHGSNYYHYLFCFFSAGIKQVHTIRITVCPYRWRYRAWWFLLTELQQFLANRHLYQFPGVGYPRYRFRVGGRSNNRFPDQQSQIRQMYPLQS
jgi:hypothetical protein